MIYLDSCALVKLIHDEAESTALQAWLDERAEEVVVTSELAQVEVCRVVRRNNHTAQGVLVDPEELALDLADAAHLLASVDQVIVNRDLLIRAGAHQEPMVRTLDAIHLVSALAMPGTDPDDRVFVTYDRTLAAAARQSGLTVLGPS